MKRYIRKRFLVGLVIVLTLLGSAYGVVRLLIDPEAIRRRAIAALSELTDVEANVESARFDPLTGLTIDDLTFSVKDDDGRDKVLLRVPHVKLRHRLWSLFSGDLTYSSVTIRDGQFFVERSGAGTYNFERLLAAFRRRHTAKEALPTIRLDRARFYYTDHLLSDGDGRPLNVQLQNVNATISPVTGHPHMFNANVWMNDPAFGRWTVRQAKLNTSAKTLVFKAKSTAVALDEELKGRLTGRARQIWERFSPSGGTVRLVAAFTYDGHAEKPIDFEMRAHIEDAAASDERFPYKITDVNGALVFRAGGIELENLRGRSGSSPVTFEGSFSVYKHGGPYSMRIEGKGIRLDAKLRSAFKEGHRRVWDDFSPEGLADVTCVLERKRSGERTRVRILAGNSPTTRVATTYRRFQYPLELEGWVFYDAGVVSIVQEPVSTEELADFVPGMLLARHKDTVLEVRGGLGRGKPYKPLRLDFRLQPGCVLPLDDDLKKAVSPGMRRVWDYLDLAGTTRGTCRVERTDPEERRLDVAVEFTDIKSRLCCRDFPYEIRNPQGSVLYQRSAARFPRGRLLVRNLRTDRGGAAIEMEGEISGFRPEKPVEKMDMAIRAANVALDDELHAVVPERYSRLWEHLSPTPESRVNVECRLERTRPDAERMDFSLKIDSLDSSLMCRYFPYRVSHVRGSAEFERNERFPEGLLRLRDLRGNGGDCRVGVTGFVAGFEADKSINSVHLIIEGKEVPLDGKLRLALSEEHRKAFDTFHPEGVADVVCTLKRSSREENLSTVVSIKPLGSSICYDGLPVRVTDVAGRISIADGVIKVTKMRGRAAGGVVMLDGVVHRSAGQPGGGLTVEGRDVVLGGEVEEVLPEKYRELWRKLRPRGKATFSATVKPERTASGEKTVAYSAVIQPQGASLRLGLKVKDLTGLIRLAGIASGKGHDFRGKAELATTTVNGNTFRHLRGSFEKHENLFNIYELHGKLHDGDVAAQLRVQLNDPITYGIVADVRSFSLNGLLKKAFDVKSDELHGRLSGTVLLQGQGTDPGNLVGRADVRVRDGKLGEALFVLRLLKVLNLSLPERTAFTDATARLDFYDRRINVKEMNLLGDAVSIYGRGTVQCSGAVDLTFITGFGRLRLPELPVVSSVVREIQKQIVSVKMTGSLLDPKIEILPFAPFTVPMKDIVENGLAAKQPVKEQK